MVGWKIKESRLRYESGSEKGWRKAPRRKTLGSEKGGCKIGCEKDGCVIGSEGDCENRAARTKLKAERQARRDENGVEEKRGGDGEEGEERTSDEMRKTARAAQLVVMPLAPAAIVAPWPASCPLDGVALAVPSLVASKRRCRFLPRFGRFGRHLFLTKVSSRASPQHSGFQLNSCDRHG